MDTMYRRRTAGRGSRTGTRKKSGGMCAREKRRLIQLGASLALFLLVFFGRGVLPAQMAFWRSVLTADTDFKGAVTAFGQTLSEEGSVLEALEVFWADLTGLQENGQTGQNDLAAVEQPELPGYPSRAAHPAFGSLPAFQQTVRNDLQLRQQGRTAEPGIVHDALDCQKVVPVDDSFMVIPVMALGFFSSVFERLLVVNIRCELGEPLTGHLHSSARSAYWLPHRRQSTSDCPDRFAC